MGNGCGQGPCIVRIERRLVNDNLVANVDSSLGYILSLMDKSGYGFARSRIPEIGALRFRAGRQDPSAVRTKRRVKAPTQMGKRGDELARGLIPDIDAMIRTRRQDPRTVRTERRL